MVATLCAQHCETDDLCNMIRAFADPLFPTFFEHIPGLLAARPNFRGCALEILDNSQASGSAGDICLGPHCQCASREEAHRRRWGQQQGAPAKQKAAAGKLSSLLSWIVVFPPSLSLRPHAHFVFVRWAVWRSRCWRQPPEQILVPAVGRQTSPCAELGSGRASCASTPIGQRLHGQISKSGSGDGTSGIFPDRHVPPGHKRRLPLPSCTQPVPGARRNPGRPGRSCGFLGEAYPGARGHHWICGRERHNVPVASGRGHLSWIATFCIIVLGVGHRSNFGCVVSGPAARLSLVLLPARCGEK